MSRWRTGSSHPHPRHLGVTGPRAPWLVRTGLALILAFLANTTTAQSRPDPGPESEFHMARLKYGNAPDSWSGSWRPMWAIDYPEAEFHFIQGVRRLTRVQSADDSIHLALTDDRIFDYPWLFVQQVGHWSLSGEEIARLREYLQRGGFLVVDDFHGVRDWATFVSVIRRVLPDRPIVSLPEGDEILHVFYDLDQRTQIPGRRHLVRLRSGEIGAQMMGPATWRGIYDEEGRLLVAINYNMDMGDAWEHADDPVYPEPMTALAYRFGINYLIYGMTH